jgi:hypothetical protein
MLRPYMTPVDCTLGGYIPHKKIYFIGIRIYYIL